MPPLSAVLAASLAPWQGAKGWCVALSGGLDSTVLLHLLAELREQRGSPCLSAVHVHHGLQPEADLWVQHCQTLCEQLAVPLTVLRVKVDRAASLERAAREARYAAFAQVLSAGQVLLLGQHADDQAETLLFRLMRGAGVLGLAAMPESRVLGAGHLLRPLLSCSRSALERYAKQYQLSWVQDPSNSDERFARNFLRHKILAELKRYWPDVELRLARTAQHSRETQQLLDELAEQDLAAARGQPLSWLNSPSLDLQVLQSLSESRQCNALRFWLRSFGSLPDQAHWQGWRNVRDAAEDSQAHWDVAGGRLVRAQRRIWWLSKAWLVDVVTPPNTPLMSGVTLLPGNGHVCLMSKEPLQGLHVRYRKGGEVLDIPGRGRRDLKRLLNENKLPMFIRDRLPLLCKGDEVVAVANLPQLNAQVVRGLCFSWQLVD